MHSRNPISSLSRRLLVGTKTCEKYFMGAWAPLGAYRLLRAATPEPVDYYKNSALLQQWNYGLGV